MDKSTWRTGIRPDGTFVTHSNTKERRKMTAVSHNSTARRCKCGGKAEVRVVPATSHLYRSEVVCSQCNMSTKLHEHHSSADAIVAAIAEWNGGPKAAIDEKEKPMADALTPPGALQALMDGKTLTNGYNKICFLEDEFHDLNKGERIALEGLYGWRIHHPEEPVFVEGVFWVEAITTPVYAYSAKELAQYAGPGKSVRIPPPDVLEAIRAYFTIQYKTDDIAENYAKIMAFFTIDNT